MGEVSEMMNDGTLCVHCGTYIDEGKAKGFPRSCCQKLPYKTMAKYVRYVENQLGNDAPDFLDSHEIGPVNNSLTK